jgi:hypothetical protein
VAVTCPSWGQGTISMFTLKAHGLDEINCCVLLKIHQEMEKIKDKEK